MQRTWQCLGVISLILLMGEMPAIAAALEQHQTRLESSDNSLAIAQPTRENAIPIQPSGSALLDLNKQNIEASGILLQVEDALSEDDATLNDESYYDEYFFEGQTGQIIKINLESQAFDTYLLLDDKAGERIAENNDVGNNTHSEIVVQLPTAGKYRILANSLDKKGEGAYQLTVTLATVEELRQAERRDIAAQLQALPELNKIPTAIEDVVETVLQVEGTLEPGDSTVENGSFYDEYSFEGQAGQTITIHLDGIDYDSKLILLNPADDILADNHDWDSWDSQILITLPEDGAYRVLASAYYDEYHGRTWGDYILTISRQESGLDESGFELTQYYPEQILFQGAVHYHDREYQEALRHFQAALASYWQFGDRLGESQALGEIGNVYSAIGDNSQALDYYQRSLAIIRVLGDRRLEVIGLGNIGSVYHSLGDSPRALDYYQQALAISLRTNDIEGKASSLNSIGSIYHERDDYTQALDYFQETLAIVRNAYNEVNFNDVIYLVNIDLIEAVCLSNIGDVYASLEDYPQALDYYQQSLAIARDKVYPDLEASNLVNIGNVYHSLGNYPQALDYYQQSLEITRDIGDRPSEADTLKYMGIALFESGQLPEAEEKLFEAITLLESLRVRDRGDALNITQLELQKSTYGVLQQVLVARNQPQRALEIAERGRARALVDILAKASELQPIEQSFSTNAPDIAQIQQIVRRQNSILVEYSFIETSVGNPQIYIWVLQPNGKLHFRQVDLNHEDLAALVMHSREAIGVRNRGGLQLAATHQAADVAQLLELHQLLIAPIADLLPQNAPDQHVIFIPHEDLFFVPFAALIDANGDYLIQKHTILTASSIQVLDLTQQKQMALEHSEPLTADALLVVGNPAMPEVWSPAASAYQQLATLPGAEQEVLAIANFFDVQPWLNATATEQRLKQHFENARVIHFATHGLLEYGRPEDSGFRNVPGAIALTPSLGEDGLLTSAEIRDFNLQAELVVLSACDTGLGEITGDGVIGLSRSLFEAGTPSVIVSLWSVPDAPTADLMTEFYRQWQSGLDKAQALRQAMLATMETHPAPRDWAAFTLIGEAD